MASVNRKLAVCMPAYNAAHTIRKSIQCILEQTYEDFSFVITDDCSTDDTLEIVHSIHDPRIVTLRNESNLGPAGARNVMLDYCISEGYEYMALMDADDIVYPERLSRQLQIMESTPGLSACGGSMLMEKNGATWIAPRDSDDIVVEAVFANPIPTPTALLRVADLERTGLVWRDSFVPCDDYHFWYEFLFVHRLKAANTGEVEGVYVHSPAGVSHGRGIIRQEEKDALVKQLILDQLGIQTEYEDVFKFMRVGLGRSETSSDLDGFLAVGSQLLAAEDTDCIRNSILREKLETRTRWYLAAVEPLGVRQRRQLYRAFMPEAHFYREETVYRLRRLRDERLRKMSPGLAAGMSRVYRALVKPVRR